MNAPVMLEAAMSIIDKPEPKPRGLRAVYAWMLANAQGIDGAQAARFRFRFVDDTHSGF